MERYPLAQAYYFDVQDPIDRAGSSLGKRAKSGTYKYFAAEVDILRRYYRQTQQSQSDVIREFIRSLQPSLSTVDSSRS